MKGGIFNEVRYGDDAYAYGDLTDEEWDDLLCEDEDDDDYDDDEEDDDEEDDDEEDDDEEDDDEEDEEW